MKIKVYPEDGHMWLEAARELPAEERENILFEMLITDNTEVFAEVREKDATLVIKRGGKLAPLDTPLSDDEFVAEYELLVEELCYETEMSERNTLNMDATYEYLARFTCDPIAEEFVENFIEQVILFLEDGDYTVY